MCNSWSRFLYSKLSGTVKQLITFPHKVMAYLHCSLQLDKRLKRTCKLTLYADSTCLETSHSKQLQPSSVYISVRHMKSFGRFLAHFEKCTLFYKNTAKVVSNMSC